MLVGWIQDAISYNLLRVGIIQYSRPSFMVAIILIKGILYLGVLTATILVSIGMFIPAVLGMVSVILLLGVKRFVYDSG